MDYVFELEESKFEWDTDKALSNYRKHGVTFEVAAEVFFDPFHVVGDASANQEQRDFAIGYCFEEDLLIVIHIERSQRIRIISARPVTPRERSMYEKGQSSF
ncbi:BrnT family toxin [filamentous cyanobacterium LEGE 11480]|uniref:BrnT family toxin n=1 Tax=Romeriopsis navalis LEGE 11480 TaxID=2777977 RepID=A0A928VNW9_9CYAN|nr:BrnT family toxin [Romeriopsis navalis]MBE9030176.1 BrnT family toxin [Romeriopsis navalis LEGE 11480]